MSWQVRLQVSVSVYILYLPIAGPGTWDRAVPVPQRVAFPASRPPRRDNTGVRMAPRKPPFCIIRRFFPREVFFVDNVLKFCLLCRNLAFCCVVSGTFPRSMFFAQSLMQSTNALLHFSRTVSLPFLPVYLFIRFSTGRNLLIQSLMMK